MNAIVSVAAMGATRNPDLGARLSRVDFLKSQARKPGEAAFFIATIIFSMTP